MERKIIYTVSTDHLFLLIPKKKGDGFIKTPIGHHSTDLSVFIEKQGYECSGLDGYISIETGFTHKKDFTDLMGKIGTFISMSFEKIEYEDFFNILLK